MSPKKSFTKQQPGKRFIPGFRYRPKKEPTAINEPKPYKRITTLKNMRSHTLLETLRKIDLDISKNLPKKYSDLSDTIRYVLLVEKYPSVISAVESLRKIDLAISKDLPPEYSRFSNDIRSLMLDKTSLDVTSALNVLLYVEADSQSKKLKKELRMLKE